MFQYENPDNLVTLLEDGVSRFPDNRFIGTKDAGGVYRWTTYGEVGSMVDNLRTGLSSLGVGRGDAVGVIGKNSLEWVTAAFATYGLGAKWVPMYEAESMSVRRYIIADAHIKILFVQNAEIYEQVKGLVDEISSLKQICVVEGEASGCLRALMAKGRENSVASVPPSPDDIATLIYTSGTTGDPKGVLLSHGNLTSNAMAGYRVVTGLDENCLSLSILPWAHSYGLTAELHAFMLFGGAIAIAESVQTIAQDIIKAKPTHLIAVPRVFNKIYQGILTAVNEKGGLPKKMFVQAVSYAEQNRVQQESGRRTIIVRLMAWILDKLVFRKIRDRFGGRLEAGLTASATMDKEIALFFYNAGIPISDCYGLSETSPAATMNSLEEIRFGSVGRSVEHVTVVIDTSAAEGAGDGGEIVIYGPNVMQGYHNKPEETRAVMTDDGGFRTGDLGRLDEDGFLYITGRIKEQYKLENGKYVFPASIEESIKLLPDVANAMVYGVGHAYNVCVIVPDPDALQKIARDLGLSGDPEALVGSPEIQHAINEKILALLDDKYGGYEIPRKFLYIVEDFTVENGMLTQTMKLKRRIVEAQFKDQIVALYD